MKSIKMLTENIEKTKKELMDAKPKQKDKKQVRVGDMVCAIFLCKGRGTKGFLKCNVEKIQVVKKTNTSFISMQLTLMLR